ncbi:MAG: AAA family ATPase [Ginsengibacter sp.]
MKVLRIRIKNLASLEGVTSINFNEEPLCSAGIFAITGATGAGKSTILDALCLALYGQTPRYNQGKEAGIEIKDAYGSSIKQGDHRGILRDGTGEGFAEVDFIGVDGHAYTSSWKVRRARDKAEGSIQPDTIELKNLSSGQIIPGKKKEIYDEIERLVGLNFEQFSRSVLLAQGDFTAFLKAGKDEKSSLLEKLTGTHIYSEISKRIFEKYKEESQELRDLNFQREGIYTFTQEELSAFAQQKKDTETVIKTRQKEVDELNRELTWHLQHDVLQTNLANAKTTFELVIETKKNAVAREEQLKQAEQVQPARSWVDSRRLTEKQLEEKSLELQTAEDGLTNLQLQKDGLEVLLQTAGEDLITKAKAQDDAKPLLEEAKTLDVQLRERNGQALNASTELKEASENHTKHQEQIEIKQGEAKQLESNIELLKKWKDENISRQAVAENEKLIVSKLSDAKKLLEILQSLSTNIETTNETISERQLEKEKSDRQLGIIGNELKIAQAGYDTKLATLSTVNLPSLEEEKDKIDTKLESIIQAEAHWRILFVSQSELNSLIQKITINKKEEEDKTALLKDATKEFNTIQIKRETSLRILEKARLAAAENIESLRSQLIPGDPCPVCGSEDHPYAIHNPQLDHVLAKLESEHQENETAYNTCLQKESALEETCRQLQKTVIEQEAELASKEIVLQQMKDVWVNFSIYKECNLITDEQKAAWLKQQILEKKSSQKNLHYQIQSYHKDKLQLDTQHQYIGKLEKQQTENSNTIKDVERTLQSLKEQLAQHNREQSKANNELLETETILSPFFSIKDWFHHWKSGPQKFTQRVSQFAEEWKENAQKLETDSHKFGMLSATLKAMEEQSKTLLTEVGKKKNGLTSVTAQLDELTEKRKAIFDGEEVLKIEKRLKISLDNAQQTLEQHKTDREKLQIESTRLSTQKMQAEKDILAFQLQMATYSEKIKRWLNSYNLKNASLLDETILEDLLSLEPGWIEAERAALRDMDDAVTKSQSVMNERTNSLQEHEKQRISERQPAELNEILKERKLVLDQAVKELNEIEFKIQQDSVNKQKIGKLLKAIEAKVLVVENWAKLNDIIGSADGKKFRQIAQEYTLDILLSYANIHLEMLSKRYLLQRIPDTLGLQVLDQDMGNEIRTVFSLSGGESFLVSLALALGLASLSSSRMQVESLFIDEGFGSLDPATLNIAMDALERLHNQGRKVGVISHVQEMTERIPVRINVSKQNSGRSKVEIQ